NCLEKSEKRGVQAAGNGPSETGSVGSALERFSFVLRTSWVWAGSTIPLAPKERQFIAWGRQNKLHIGRKPLWPKGFTCTRHISIGALGLWPICNLYVSPRTRRHVKKSLFQPRRGDSRAVAEPYWARFNDGRFRVPTEPKLRPLARFGCSMVWRVLSALRAHPVELTVKSWEVVGYFALSCCGRG